MKSVVIVGDGVIGRCVAYYTAKQGHRVTIIERSGRDHDGCSFGNAGMITPSHFVPLAAPGAIPYALRSMWNAESPVWLKPRLDFGLIGWGLKFSRASTKARVDRAAPLLRDMNVESLRLFTKFAGRGDEFGLITKGMLMLCNTEAGLDVEREHAAHAQRLGVEARILSAREIAEMEPDVRMSIVGGAYYPQDAQLVPSRFMSFLGERLAEAGVESRYETKVTGWIRRGGGIGAVRTDAGEIKADEFVIAGGSWSPALVRDLGLSLPLQPGKGYSLTIEKPKAKPRRGLILSEAHVAITPMDDVLRIGGTMEIAGFDERVNPARVRGIIKSATAYLPDYDPKELSTIEPWYGLRPLSPDGLPYIGRFGKYENLWAATGHAMLGLSLGPITGKLVAELLSGSTPSLPTVMLSPDRYS